MNPHGFHVRDSLRGWAVSGLKLAALVLVNCPRRRRGRRDQPSIPGEVRELGMVKGWTRGPSAAPLRVFVSFILVDPSPCAPFPKQWSHLTLSLSTFTCWAGCLWFLKSLSSLDIPHLSPPDYEHATKQQTSEPIQDVHAFPLHSGFLKISQSDTKNQVAVNNSVLFPGNWWLYLYLSGFQIPSSLQNLSLNRGPKMPF